MYIYIYRGREGERVCPWLDEGLKTQGAVSFEEMRIWKGFEMNFANSPGLRLILPPEEE